LRIFRLCRTFATIMVCTLRRTVFAGALFATILAWTAIAPFAKACTFSTLWAIATGREVTARRTIVGIFACATLCMPLARRALLEAVLLVTTRCMSLIACRACLVVAWMKAATRCILMGTAFAVRRFFLTCGEGGFHAFNDAFFHLLPGIALNAEHTSTFTHMRQTDG